MKIENDLAVLSSHDNFYHSTTPIMPNTSNLTTYTHTSQR